MRRVSTFSTLKYGEPLLSELRSTELEPAINAESETKTQRKAKQNRERKRAMQRSGNFPSFHASVSR